MKLEKYDFIICYLLAGALAYLIFSVLVSALTKGCLS